MGLINETRAVILNRTPHRTVEALVRVRGVDVRAGHGGLHIERQEPVAVVVTEAGQEHNYRMPQPVSAGMVVMALAAPIVARAIARTLKPKRSK